MKPKKITPEERAAMNARHARIHAMLKERIEYYRAKCEPEGQAS